MKIGMVVNNIATEVNEYTTTYLAMTATNMGHEVWYIGVGDMGYEPDGFCYAHALQVAPHHFRSGGAYLKALRDKTALAKRISLDELDVLMLRNDPAEDVVRRPWARLAGINFGRIALRNDIIVLNDPDGLAHAVNKMYLLSFPDEISPRTFISRDRDEIKRFIHEHGGNAVLKPLTGSGGHNVFLVRPEDGPNLNQMIDAVSSEGYVVVQDYLPDAVHGDTRLFLMNGVPLMAKGRYAAFRRVRQPGDNDMRSNMSAGAVAAKAEVTENMLMLAEKVRPRLIKDGMFLVGLDIVGNRIMEINVFSPGGLYGASQLEGVSFAREVIHSLERKVEYRHKHQNETSNVAIAVL